MRRWGSSTLATIARPTAQLIPKTRKPAPKRIVVLREGTLIVSGAKLAGTAGISGFPGEASGTAELALIATFLAIGLKQRRDSSGRSQRSEPCMSKPLKVTVPSVAYSPMTRPVNEAAVSADR
ncbi:hypothetical protein Acsp01_81470 [Actinoplanes sp. NBRC 101535]|nr:hypothetical protein Acsp01_81470 [Actinoplanes sp. NBRC 101535]